jgi:hypothetical protein
MAAQLFESASSPCSVRRVFASADHFDARSAAPTRWCCRPGSSATCRTGACSATSGCAWSASTPPLVDLKTVQEQLGHTSIVLTADAYTSVLLDLHFKVAEATARLVLKAAARNPGRRHRSKISPPKSAAPDQPTRPEPVRPKRSRTNKRADKGRAPVTHTNQQRIAMQLYGLLRSCAPPETRTPNPRI